MNVRDASIKRLAGTARSLFGVLLPLMLCAPAPPALAADAADAPDTSPGLWRSQQLEFEYVGFTSTYSCDGLQNKLEVLLRRLGAGADAKVSTSGCMRGEGVPSKFVHATLHFATLQPAEASTNAALVTDANAPPVGAWRQVVLAPHEPRELDAGDCELIEQFRDRILPLFATRGPHNRVQCVPFQESAGYSLQLDVFAPRPPAKTR
jgi:hypothetical protein